MADVRRALVEDAPRLAEIHVKSWQVTYAGIFAAEFLNGLSIASRHDWWSRRLAQMVDRADVLVAESAGAVVGFAAVGPSREEAGGRNTHQPEGELYSIYLAPERFGLGIGRELMAASESCLIDLGFDEAILWVIDANDRARRFYEAAGWSTDGALKLEDIGGVQVTELRYRKRLANAKDS